MRRYRECRVFAFEAVDVQGKFLPLFGAGFVREIADFGDEFLQINSLSGSILALHHHGGNRSDNSTHKTVNQTHHRCLGFSRANRGDRDIQGHLGVNPAHGCRQDTQVESTFASPRWL